MFLAALEVSELANHELCHGTPDTHRHAQDSQDRPSATTSPHSLTEVGTTGRGIGLLRHLFAALTLEFVKHRPHYAVASALIATTESVIPCILERFRGESGRSGQKWAETGLFGPPVARPPRAQPSALGIHGRDHAMTDNGYRLRLPAGVDRDVQAYQQNHPNFTCTADALRSLVVIGLKHSQYLSVPTRPPGQGEKKP